MSLLDYLFIFGLPVLIIIIGLSSTPRRLPWEGAVVTYALFSILVPLAVSPTAALANAILSVIFDSVPQGLVLWFGAIMRGLVLIIIFPFWLGITLASREKVPAAHAKWSHMATAGGVLVLLNIGAGAYLLWSNQHDIFLPVTVGTVLMWGGIALFIVGQYHLVPQGSDDQSTEEPSETD